MMRQRTYITSYYIDISGHCNKYMSHIISDIITILCAQYNVQILFITDKCMNRIITDILYYAHNTMSKFYLLQINILIY